MNVATAVECLELLPKPYEKMKHIPNFVPELILHDMARKGLVKIVGTVSILCVIYDESEGFLDDNFEKVPQKLRDFFGTRFPVKMKGNVRVKSIMHVESDSSYWDEVDEILKYERENYCPNGHALCFCGSNNIRYVDKPPLYRMTGKGLDFMNQAERFTGNVDLDEALELLEAEAVAGLPGEPVQTPVIEPPATDAPTPAVATGTPVGDKSGKEKWKLHESLTIDDILPHIALYRKGSNLWVAAKKVGGWKVDTLYRCSKDCDTIPCDGVYYGVDKDGRVFCKAGNPFYYLAETTDPEGKKAKAFYTRVRKKISQNKK